MCYVVPTAGGETSRRTAPEILATLCTRESTAPIGQMPSRGVPSEEGSDVRTKCVNCRGKHAAHANVCAQKRRPGRQPRGGDRHPHHVMRTMLRHPPHPTAHPRAATTGGVDQRDELGAEEEHATASENMEE